MAKYNSAVILDFKGVNLFRRFNTVQLSSPDGLQKVRSCLQQHRPVKVAFDGTLEPVKARYIDFLQGLSGYFGAELKSAR